MEVVGIVIEVEIVSRSRSRSRSCGCGCVVWLLSVRDMIEVGLVLWMDEVVVGDGECHNA